MKIYRIRIQADILRVEYWDDFGTQYQEPLPVEATVEDNPTPAEAMNELRLCRTARLIECDWTQLEDAPLTPAQKEAYKEYRQALRDYPASVDSVAWTAAPYPQKPVL
jgi:hypothetical protein